MTISVKKWGNSLALRIPKDVVKSLNINDSSLLDLELEDDRVILKPKRDNLLDLLLDKINDDNIHAEINTNRAVGNEEW